MDDLSEGAVLNQRLAGAAPPEEPLRPVTEVPLAAGTSGLPDRLATWWSGLKTGFGILKFRADNRGAP